MTDGKPEFAVENFKHGSPDTIRSAWSILAGGAPTAAAALVYLAEHAKSEVARVQASTAVLDRVGIATPKERPTVQVNVIPAEFDETPHIGKLTPAEVIRSRLKSLKGPTEALVQGQEAAVYAALGLDGGEQEEPVDAEVVEAELMPLEAAVPSDDEDDWGSPWA